MMLVNTSGTKRRNIRDLYMGINDFKKGYQSRTNIVKDGNGDLVTLSHSILTRWRNHVCLLLISDRQKDVQHSH
jgi:hypothetical protein